MTLAELFVKLKIQAGAAELAEIDQFLRRAEKKADGFLGRFNKKAGAWLGGALKTGLLGAGAAIAGVFAYGAKDAIDFERGLARLDIASSGVMGSMQQVRDSILQVSRETGVAKEEILAGASSFVALTGDGKAAAQSMALFARISKATGASMEDIAGASAALMQNLKIAPAEFEKAFSILIRGGKLGAVELKDMAGLLAGLAPLAERFAGGGGVAGLAKLGGAFQLVRQGTGSAAEAATALESLMGAIVSHAGKLRKAGVKVFDEKTVNGKKVKELRSLDAIIKSISKSKLGTDQEALIDALGRKEALAAYIQLTKVQGAWGRIAAETLLADDVAKDYANYQNSTAGKLEKAWNAVKVQVAEAFTPDRIQAFADTLMRALEMAGKLVNFLSDIGYGIEQAVGNSEARDAGEKAAQEVAAKGGGGIEQIEAYKKAKEESQRQQLLRGVNSAKGRADVAAVRRTATSNAIQIANQITMNIKGVSDPLKAAAAMRIELDKWWDARLRELQGATPP